MGFTCSIFSRKLGIIGPGILQEWKLFVPVFLKERDIPVPVFSQEWYVFIYSCIFTKVLFKSIFKSGKIFPVSLVLHIQQKFQECTQD